MEHLYGKKIRGMAYPYGTYSEKVMKKLSDNGFEYARTVNSVYNFSIPENFLQWHPTCHFKDNRIWELAEQFLNGEFSNHSVFYIWGHSYELVNESQWQEFEDFCKYIHNRQGISYFTNIEFLDSVKSK